MNLVSNKKHISFEEVFKDFYYVAEYIYFWIYFSLLQSIERVNYRGLAVTIASFVHFYIFSFFTVGSLQDVLKRWEI